MKNQHYFLILVALVAILFTTGCEPDEPDVINEEELITTMNLTLIPVNGGTTVSFGFQDLDGDGGDAPVITSGTLEANTEYRAQVELSDLTVTPAENITMEVAEEDDEHQFFYAPSASLNLTFAYGDADDDGNPIGIITTMTTGAASTGTLTVTLRHEPNKFGANVSDGDIANAGGETDIEVEFPVTIN